MMAEAGSATTRRTRTGLNYASQWNHFVAWSRASGKCSLPASPEDVAAYLEDRSGDWRKAIDPAGGRGGDSPQPQGRRFRRAGP